MRPNLSPQWTRSAWSIARLAGYVSRLFAA